MFLLNLNILNKLFIISAQKRLGMVSKQREIYIGIGISYWPKLFEKYRYIGKNVISCIPNSYVL